MIGYGSRVFIDGQEAGYVNDLSILPARSLKCRSVTSTPDILRVYQRGAIREFYRDGRPVRTPGWYDRWDLTATFQFKAVPGSADRIAEYLEKTVLGLDVDVFDGSPEQAAFVGADVPTETRERFRQ